MPALEAFRVKWKIGSDDLVFPFAAAIAFRVVWLLVISIVLVFFSTAGNCGELWLLKVYLFVLLALHGTMGMVELSGLIVSARGTIANPSPRRHIHIVLYVLTACFMIEFAWDIVGFLWAFDPDLECGKQHNLLLFVRCLLVWNTWTSVVVTGYMFFRIGMIHCCCMPKRMRYEEVAPSESYGGRRLSRISSDAVKRHMQRRRWQWRLQSVLCCLRLKPYQHSVFTEVAVTLADVFRKFRGYVPSDLAAGLALLALSEQRQMKVSPSASQCALNLSEKDDRIILKRISRFFTFAASIYGYPCFLKESPILGGLHLLGGCCCCAKGGSHSLDELSIVGDNSCKWNLRALLKSTGLKRENILFAQFQPEVYLPAFFVAVDHKEKAIVISIRGTRSLVDLLTDLAAQPDLLSSDCFEDFSAHTGCAQSAQALLFKLKTEGILDSAFLLYPNYRLVVTGHSLGAGTATIVALLMKNSYNNVHCYAFSPPGGLLSQNAVTYTRSFVTTVTFGDDLVPRLSLQAVEDMGERMLQAIHFCNKPKYQILIASMLMFLGCPSSCLGVPSQFSGVQLLSNDSSAEEGRGDQLPQSHDNAKSQDPRGSIDKLTGKRIIQASDRVNLYLPGRILHITARKGKGCCGKMVYEAQWVGTASFSEILVNRSMWKHHMTGNIAAALTAMKKQANIQ